MDLCPDDPQHGDRSVAKPHGTRTSASRAAPQVPDRAWKKKRKPLLLKYSNQKTGGWRCTRPMAWDASAICATTHRTSAICATTHRTRKQMTTQSACGRFWWAAGRCRPRRCICPKPSATCLEGSQCHTVYRAWCHSPARCRSGACPPRGRACRPNACVAQTSYSCVPPNLGIEDSALVLLLFFHVEDLPLERPPSTLQQRRRATAH